MQPSTEGCHQKNEKVATWMFEKTNFWKLVHLSPPFLHGSCVVMCSLDPDPKTSCSFSGMWRIHDGASDSSHVPQDMIFLQEWNN